MNIAEKLTAIAENEQRVYGAGYMHGSNDGYVKGEQNGYAFGFDEGKKSEYDAFWDVFQSNGNLTSYNYAFAYGKFNDDTFRPKYDIVPTSANYMFSYNNTENVGTTARDCITDFVGCLNRAGVILDTSNTTDMNNMFYFARNIRHIPTISFEACNKVEAVFYGCIRLETIDKVIFKADGTNEIANETYNLLFGQCIELRNLTVDGIIGTSVNMWQCPLSKDSITSVINALSSTASGKTLTLNKTAKEAAFTSSEWNALISTKSNWTITLA